MYSPVATGLFCFRNGGKTTNGDIGRLPVTVGQGAAVLKSVSQSESIMAKPVQVVLENCSELAKSDKFFNGLTKTVKFASDHVNPLIVASSGLKVAFADKKDRKKTLITESGCLAGMFLGEGWMKGHLDGILKTLASKNILPGGKWLPIIKGILFVIGSITASTIGSKIGKKAAEYWDKPLCKNAKEDTAAASEQNVYKPIDLKA